jgi:hypothetical protein
VFSARRKDAGVRAEQIDSTVRPNGILDDRVDAGFTAHVGDDGATAQLLRDGLRPGIGIGHNESRCPFRREPAAKRFANSVGAAGDDSNRTFEVHGLLTNS